MNEKDINMIDNGAQDEEVVTVEYIDVTVPEAKDVALESAFPPVGIQNEALNHAILYNRDAEDQHQIGAITGLQRELDLINALQTEYSDGVGMANYYEWNQGAYDEHGYFVSIVPKTTTIKVCDGSEIFGVTVDEAGFVGGQDGTTLNHVNGITVIPGIPRDNKYALVVTSGLVDVRCEIEVKVDDYVVSNDKGYAKKTESKSGYKVLARENKGGVEYAVIMLGVQADVTDLLDKEIQVLESRMDEAAINIATTMALADETYKKLEEIGESNDHTCNEVADALEKVDGAISDVDDMKEQLEDALVTVSQSKEIAESAVTSAESIKNEAVERANEALDKAVQNEEDFQRLILSIDKYSVGEYSQAYGLTLQQARNVLKEGMVYIPTKHGDVETHKEKYAYGENQTLERDFTYGFYYVWTTLSDGEFMWSEAIGEVWFAKEQPAGSEYTYWYNGDKLFVLDGDKWQEVATLAGNVNNRITSMIRQTAEEINVEIVNARGSFDALYMRIDDDESKLQTITTWTLDEEGKQYNLATIQQKADEASADIALVVAEKDGEKVINAASIIAAINDDESSVTIDADKVNIVGSATFLTGEDLGKNGATVIYGGRIETGTITADQIASDAITADKIKAGEINAGHIDTTGLSAEKIEVKDSGGNTIFTADATTNTVKMSAACIGGKLTADQINANGLEVDAANITGELSTVTLNINGNFIVHESGNVELNGDVVWGTGSSPTQAVYARTAIEKPADGTTPSTFDDDNVDTWHKVFDKDNDFFASYTYDGGAVWTEAIKIRGTDGIDGDGATVTSEAVFDAITQDKTKFGCFTTHDGGLFINASAINTGYLSADRLELRSITADKINTAGLEAEKIEVKDGDKTVFLADAKQLPVYIGGFSVDTMSLRANNDGGSVYVGTDKIELGKTFTVTSDGKLTASNADIFGTVRANKGYVGGWTIADDGLVKGQTYLLTGDKHPVPSVANPGDSSEARIAVGRPYTDYDTQTFTGISQTHGSGGVGYYRYESNSLPAGYEVASVSLSSESSGYVCEDIIVTEVAPDHICVETHSTSTVWDSLKIDITIKYLSAFNPRFVVLEDGSLYSSAANITCGKIGGWEINSGDLCSASNDNQNRPNICLSPEGRRMTVSDLSSVEQDWIMRVGDQLGITDEGNIYSNALIYVSTNGSDYSNLVMNRGLEITGSNSTMGDGVCYITNAGHYTINASDLSTFAIPNNFVFGALKGGSTPASIVASDFIGMAISKDGAVDIHPKSGSQIAIGNTTDSNNALYGTWKLNGSTNITSDRNLKHDIEILDDKYSDLFDDLKPVKFKYNDGMSNRYHTGFISQDVCDSISKAGLTTNDFAAYVESKNTDNDTIECGLRYDEFISLNTWQIQKLKKRVEELETKLVELEAAMKRTQTEE